MCYFINNLVFRGFLKEWRSHLRQLNLTFRTSFTQQVFCCFLDSAFGRFGLKIESMNLSIRPKEV